MTRMLILSSLLAATLAVPSHGATPASYAALDLKTSTACIAASGFKDATIGAPLRFSDRFLMDARTVTGTYPQAHMKGATGTMLCLYNRRTKRAETQEMVMPQQPLASNEMKDIRWRATDMGGASVRQSAITLMFGSDGKITGKSACNNYSANYSLSGNDLRVYPGMIGTRMACPPDVMAQETQFRKMLAAASSAKIQADGMMTIAGPGGQVMTFMRAPEAAN
jgi:heat shock protein HslJ